MNIGYRFAQCPFGSLLVAQSAAGVCYLAFTDESSTTAMNAMRASLGPELRYVADAGLDGVARRLFDSAGSADGIKLDLRGTAFQRRIWAAVQRIPFGQTRSYQAIASSLGMPNAARAVGGAIAANRIGYLVPCHRVIQAGGGLGGYRWGPARKAALLAWEQAGAAAPQGAATG